MSLDWSQRDTKLFTAMFARHKANACSVCNSLSHHTSFCPLMPGDKSADSRSNRSSEAKNKSLWPRTFVLGKEVCNNYNSSKGCTFPNCHCSHICLDCHESHPKFAVLLNAQTPPPMLSRLLLVVNDLTIAKTLMLANMILSDRSTTRFFSL